MLFLYSTALFLLGLAHFVIKRRVASLEKKYLRVAREADLLVRQPFYREGTSGKHDPYQLAKRQYLLGVLTQKRDRTEACYASWQATSDRFAKLIARVRGWKGRSLPYTFGAWTWRSSWPWPTTSASASTSARGRSCRPSRRSSSAKRRAAFCS